MQLAKLEAQSAFVFGAVNGQKQLSSSNKVLGRLRDTWHSHALASCLATHPMLWPLPPHQALNHTLMTVKELGMCVLDDAFWVSERLEA